MSKKIIIAVLISIIIVLSFFMCYLLLYKPYLNDLQTKAQTEGAAKIINVILTQINTNGYIQIPYGDNQSVILVPYKK